MTKTSVKYPTSLCDFKYNNHWWIIFGDTDDVGFAIEHNRVKCGCGESIMMFGTSAFETYDAVYDIISKHSEFGLSPLEYIKKLGYVVPDGI